MPTNLIIIDDFPFESPMVILCRIFRAMAISWMDNRIREFPLPLSLPQEDGAPQEVGVLQRTDRMRRRLRRRDRPPLPHRSVGRNRGGDFVNKDWRGVGRRATNMRQGIEPPP